MNHTHLTLTEQERAAYISGDTRTAELLGDVDHLKQENERLDGALNDAPNDDDMQELRELRQFFDDCFECLGAHYPCPEVSSDHDKSVIFDAIRKGG